MKGTFNVGKHMPEIVDTLKEFFDGKGSVLKRRINTTDFKQAKDWVEQYPDDQAQVIDGKTLMTGPVNFYVDEHSVDIDRHANPICLFIRDANLGSLQILVFVKDEVCIEDNGIFILKKSYEEKPHIIYFNW